MDGHSRGIEKRNRPPVSCEPCRTRKLKCNRGLPCDTCSKRDKASLCTYAANAARSKPSAPRSRDLKDRLKTLENLVSSFVTGDTVIQSKFLNDIGVTGGGILASQSERTRGGTAIEHGAVGHGPSTAISPLDPETPHLQKTDDGQVNYIDRSHWLSILDDIKEVREHLSLSRNSSPQIAPILEVRNGGTDASLLLVPGLALDEILESLPPQPICDMLVSWYFNTRFMVLGLIHPAKFQLEYEDFWASPSTTSPLWVGLLFAVLSITMVIRRLSNLPDPDSCIPPISVLQKRCVQCLTLGRYATANSYAMEAFILHIQSSFLGRSGYSVDPWFEVGTVIRLAFRMGYNRDPSNLAGITPFDGEMRRRVWLNVVQIDALISYQVGFPSMIPADFCDTQVPRNLDYSDMYLDMAELPPSRPLSEDTTICYVIVKASVMAVFKKIVAHTQSLVPQAYEKTLALDAEMNRAYDGIPEMLKRRDVNRAFLDNSCRIWQRSSIEMLCFKGLVILHRRYLNHEVQNPAYEPSRRACIEAALVILHRQADLYSACEPGGRLYEDRWMFYSLQVHDFLLAAMAVCLDLSVQVRQRKGAMSVLHADWDEGKQKLAMKEYQALQVSQKIWELNQCRASNKDAQTAALALGLMLRKVSENDMGLPMANEHGFGLVEGGLDMQFPHAGIMSQMLDGSENIDWALLDQYLLNFEDPASEAAARPEK